MGCATSLLQPNTGLAAGRAVTQGTDGLHYGHGPGLVV